MKTHYYYYYYYYYIPESITLQLISLSLLMTDICQCEIIIIIYIT
jgi:hypothetical protein